MQEIYNRNTPTFMATPEKTIWRMIDGTDIHFTTGKIDEWLVVYYNKNKESCFYKDIEMFETASIIAGQFHPHKVYHDLYKIYLRTNHAIQEDVLALIEETAKYSAEYSKGKNSEELMSEYESVGI